MNSTNSTPHLFAISGKIGSGKDLLSSIIQITTCEDVEILEDFYEDPQKALNDYTGVFEMQSLYTNRKFAEGIKKIVAEILGVTVRKLEDREFKEKELGPEWWYYIIEGEKIAYLETNYSDDEKVALQKFLVKLTPRKMTVLIGTEGGRDLIHPQIWVNRMYSTYKPNENGELPYWVISDLRFKTEFKPSVERNAITIRIIRYKPLHDWLDYYSIELNDISEYSNIVISDMDFTNFINKLDSESLKDVADKLNHISETDLDDVEHKYTIHNYGSIVDFVNEVIDILELEGIPMWYKIPRDL